jgi:hypothetical protein
MTVVAARDSEKLAWTSQVQQLQLALAASKDEVAAVTSSCDQRLALMADQCKAAAAAAAASESSAKASSAQLQGVKQEVAASEARVHALTAQSIAAEAELAVEKEASASAIARAHKAEAEAAAASRRADDAAAAAAAEIEGKQLEVRCVWFLRAHFRVEMTRSLADALASGAAVGRQGSS